VWVHECNEKEGKKGGEEERERGEEREKR